MPDATLSNAGVEVADADLSRTTLSPETADLLAESEDDATVIGADLGRLSDDRFDDLFGDVLQKLRAAAHHLPPANRVYVVGVTMDDGLRGTEVDVGGGDAPGVIAAADLVFAYAAADDGDGATFGHLTDDLDGVDYLLLATDDAGRLDGRETTMEALRRELVARHARRLDLLGSGFERYDEEFRFVLGAPLAAYEWVHDAGAENTNVDVDADGDVDTDGSADVDVDDAASGEEKDGEHDSA